MAEPTGLKIVEIRNQKKGSKNPNDEYVVIRNDGTQEWKLAGWEVTDQTAAQSRPHVYTFPVALTNGRAWTFSSGEDIFVMTGVGDDVFIANPTTGRPQFHFHWGRDAFVWNNSGDRVYLRHPDGGFATQPFATP